MEFRNIPNSVICCSLHSDSSTESWCLISGYVLDPELYGGPGLISAQRLSKNIYTRFRAKGIEFAVNNNGIYSIIIFDGLEKKTYLAVDKYGMSPLFISVAGQTLVFSSNFGRLVTECAKTPNYDAIQEHLELGYPLGEGTFYKEIQRVGAGTVITHHQDGTLESRQYWSFHDLDYRGLRDEDTFVSETIELFRETIATILKISQKTICLISSGYDSRRILLQLLALGSVPEAYSIDHLDLNSPRLVSLDCAVAKKLMATHPDKIHTVAPAPLATVPARIERIDSELSFRAPEHEWIYPLIDALPADGGTNFDGLSGDTLFTTPFYFNRPEIAELYADSSRMARNICHEGWSPYLAEEFFRMLSAPLHERVRAALDRLPENLNRLSFNGHLTLSRRVVSLLPNVMIAAKAESFFPYLDDRIVSHALLRDPMWKFQSETRKKILDKEFPEFASLPSSHTPFHEVPVAFKTDVSFVCEKEKNWSSDWRTIHDCYKIEHALGVFRKQDLNLSFLRKEWKTKTKLILGQLFRLRGFERYLASRRIHQVLAPLPQLIRTARILSKV